MSEMVYRFTKNNHRYSVRGNNRIDAQANAEITFGVKLNGAMYEEIYRGKVIKQGFVK